MEKERIQASHHFLSVFPQNAVGLCGSAVDWQQNPHSNEFSSVCLYSTNSQQMSSPGTLQKSFPFSCTYIPTDPSYQTVQCAQLIVQKCKNKINTQTYHPKAFVAISGDFNHASPSSTLSMSLQVDSGFVLC